MSCHPSQHDATGAVTASNTTVNGMLGVTGATTIGGTLGVTGATTISPPDVTGTFDVVGNSLLDGTLTVNGNVSMVADATVGGQAVFQYIYGYRNNPVLLEMKLINHQLPNRRDIIPSR